MDDPLIIEDENGKWFCLFEGDKYGPYLTYGDATEMSVELTFKFGKNEHFLYG